MIMVLRVYTHIYMWIHEGAPVHYVHKSNSSEQRRKVLDGVGALENGLGAELARSEHGFESCGPVPCGLKPVRCLFFLHVRVLRLCVPVLSSVDPRTFSSSAELPSGHY